MTDVVEAPPEQLAFDPDIFGSAGLNLPSEIDFDQWSAVGATLFHIGRAHQWWVGDWMVFGDQKYGQEMMQAVELDGYDPDTISQWMWVSETIPEAERRETLSWSHHRAVAGLPRKADRKKVLNRAEKEHMTVRDVEQLVRSMNAVEVEEADDSKKSKIHTFTLSWTTPESNAKTATKILEDAQAMVEAQLEELGIENARVTASK